MEADQENETRPRWSSLTRKLATVLILGYLAVVIMAPMTIPNGAPYLTTPIGQKLSPLHQALYLGHGYRFFGPDPGESHSVVFSVKQSDGSVFNGHFPDRSQTWPRLLYHRWFMLSETLFREGDNVPNQEQWSQIQKQYQETIQQYENQRRLKLKRQLTLEQRFEEQRVNSARKRRDLLIRSIARVLINRHDGESITLSVRTRRLPTPEEAQDGYHLDDPSFINLFEIGTFTREQIETGQALPVNGETSNESLPPNMGGRP